MPPVIDGLPVPEPLRQVPPRAPDPGPEEDPVDHQPVIIPPVSLPRMPGQQRLQPRPFRITEVMPPQPFLIHGTIQAETTYKIYGTRPSPRPCRSAATRHSRRAGRRAGGRHAFSGVPCVVCCVTVPDTAVGRKQSGCMFMHCRDRAKRPLLPLSERLRQTACYSGGVVLGADRRRRPFVMVAAVATPGLPLC